MDDAIKSRAIIILAVLLLILFIFNIGSCANAYNQNTARKKEMFQRIDLEEKMNKFNQEKASFAEQLKEKEKELEKEKASLQAANKELAREQSANQNLKDELDKTNRLKSALEEDLKKALATVKKAKK